MRTNRFVKNVNRSEIYLEYLKSINGILKLTNKELDILAKIIELSPDGADNSVYRNVISLQLRRTIMRESNTNKANLSKYIGKFIKSKYLILDPLTKAIHINKALVPTIVDGEVSIQFLFKIQE